MPVLQEQDFDRMAAQVVDRFMDGAKLADAATAMAQDGALNPDQIARLVHAANTQAFLRLMDQQKAQGVPDMTREFDPIDMREIVQQLVQQTPETSDADGLAPAHGTDDMAPLPCESPRHRAAQVPPADVGAMDTNDGPFPKGLKQQALDADKRKTPAALPPRDTAKEAAFRTRRVAKLAAILEDQYRQAEWAFEDAFTKLQGMFKRASGAPTPETFEKDALAIYGDSVGVAMLNMVKQAQGLPLLDMDAVAVKTAALHDRHVVEDNETNQLFATIVKIANDALRLQRGAAHARTLCN